MQIIRLAQALAQMESGAEFSCGFVTFSRKRKTGGQIIRLPSVKLLGKDWQHGLRRIEITSSGQIRVFHYRLLIEFNGKTVIY